MTKLLSDEELGDLIDIAYKTATVGDSNGDKLTKDEFRGYMLATLDTQKRLYAESVIETSKEIILTHTGADFEAGYIKGREDLRAEQRARIK